MASKKPEQPAQEAPKRGVGRPSVLSTERMQKMCDVLKIGGTKKMAAFEAGIGLTTFMTWMAKGEQAKSGQFWEFRQAVEAALQERNKRCLAQISLAGTNGSWQASAWLLERTMPEEYGRRAVDVSVGGREGAPPIPLEVTTVQKARDEVLDAMTKHFPAEGSGI
jgi:hypothetical protein